MIKKTACASRADGIHSEIDRDTIAHEDDLGVLPAYLDYGAHGRHQRAGFETSFRASYGSRR